MTSAPSSAAPDLYRFHCHGCNRRLRLARANAGNELRCSSCSVRFVAPLPAEDESLGLPTSAPAKALRRAPPQVAGNRSGVLNRADDFGHEEEFERSIDAMAAFASERPELAFPLGQNMGIFNVDAYPVVGKKPAAQAQVAPQAAPRAARIFRLWEVLLFTGMGITAGLGLGILLTTLLHH